MLIIILYYFFSKEFSRWVAFSRDSETQMWILKAFHISKINIKAGGKFTTWLLHTVNPSSEMIGALYISGKNIFWSTHVYKNRERKIFEILRCPFELPAKQHRPVSPSWPNGRCCLAGNSKGHRRISKIFLSLFLYTWVDQNIFFPEVYNAPIILELGFTVW